MAEEDISSNSKARDSIEALIMPYAHIIGDFRTTDAEVFVDSTALFRGTTGALSDDSMGLFAFAEVGFGTTAQGGVNVENLTGVPILNANIQGYIGVVTGISTCPGIGTDLGLKIDFDIADLVNNSVNVSGVTVTVTHEPTGSVKSTTTDDSFRFSSLRPGGPYKIVASKTGYSSESLDNIFLVLEDTADFKINLVAVDVEDVTVTASRVGIQASGPGLNITETDIL